MSKLDKFDFEKELNGGNLRSIGSVNVLVDKIDSQQKFDALFQLLNHSDRKVAMRAADAMEKITVAFPDFLTPHKDAIASLFSKPLNIELKWHIAQLIPRIKWNKIERNARRQTLSAWCLDKAESKIVRVNALQALHTTYRYNTIPFITSSTPWWEK